MRLIEDNMESDRYYIKEGVLEPLYMKEEERKLLIDNMETSIAKIALEVLKSHKLM